MTLPDTNLLDIRTLMLERRRALLMELAAIEKYLCITPTTAELRKALLPPRPEHDTDPKVEHKF